MKRCPKCGELFTNELLRFCRQDGERLLDPPTTLEEAATLRLSPKEVSDRANELPDSSARNA